MRVLVVAVMLCSIMSSGQSHVSGSDAAPLKIYESQGVKLKSFDFKGLESYLQKSNDTTYVVNFWATWCLPCVKELPHFEKLNHTFSHKKVKVLLVSIDMPTKVETSLIPYIKKKNLRSEVVLLNDPDANSWIDKVDKSWSGSIPATIIYNANHRKFYERSFTYEELEKELISIIK